MARVALIHWNATEGEDCAERLKRLGHEVDFLCHPGPQHLRGLLTAPPDAVVIDLSRQPSQGRAVGIGLRQRKATRLVPLVFAGGDTDKVEATRKLLPDAFYADWRGIGRALRGALRNPPKNPVVPDTMAGYAGTPLPKKLGIKPGGSVALLRAPAGFVNKLDPLPENVSFLERGSAQLVLLFVRSQAELARRFPAAAKRLQERGGLWIIWPKKTSGLATDLGEIEVRKYGMDSGFVDYKVCAVDETWSGLLFARRRQK